MLYLNFVIDVKPRTVVNLVQYKTNENMTLHSITRGALNSQLLSLLLLSCQPRVRVTPCFVYNVITDLKSIDHLCINPIQDRINTQVIYHFALPQVECTSKYLS